MKVLLIALLALTAFAEYEYEEDVLVLTADNYEQAKQDFEFLMIEFYAPWCGHCKELAPKYAEAAKALRPEGIALAKCDATVHKTLSDKYGVKGYPTIKFLIKGVAKDYEGPRNADGIKSYVLSNLNPESELVDTLEQVKDLISINKVQFFYFAEESNEKDRELRKYKEFSYTLKQHFAHTTTRSIRKALNIPAGNYFVGYNNGEAHFYKGKLSVPIMRIFVENVAAGIYDYESNKQKIDDRLAANKAVVLIFSDEQGAVLAHKEQLQEDVVFVKNPSEELYKGLLIRQSDASGLFIIKGDQKYKQLESQSAQEFLEAFRENKATKYLKSQAIPVQQGPITNLVGQTYESIYTGEEVVVLYYDSQNSEHTPVAQHYAQLAQRVQGLKFAQIDISQNEVADLNESTEVVKLRLYKGSKTFVKFIIKANKIQEERFVKFLVENSSSAKDTKEDL